MRDLRYLGKLRQKRKLDPPSSGFSHHSSYTLGGLWSSLVLVDWPELSKTLAVGLAPSKLGQDICFNQAIKAGPERLALGFVSLYFYY